MSKDRAPTSKSSWIGMAAHEIDEITTYGASRAARHARDLADAVVESGQDLLRTDPRSLARANYRPQALRARIERECAEEAKRRQILGEDDLVDLLRAARPARQLAA